MQEELETFLAVVEARTGSGLPQFVQDELAADFKQWRKARRAR